MQGEECAEEAEEGEEEDEEQAEGRGRGREGRVTGSSTAPSEQGRPGCSPGILGI